MNCKIYAGVVLGLGQFDSDVISSQNTRSEIVPSTW